MKAIHAIVGACLAVVLGGPARDVRAQDARMSPAVTSRLYEQTVNATAWVRTEDGTASGWVVDRKRGLLITNFHAVVDQDLEVHEQVGIIFPAYTQDGQLLTERQVYEENAGRLTITGTVLYATPDKDLALIRAESLPAHVRELPLAPGSARPGEQVHLIGNRGRSLLLWEYIGGSVRQVGQQQCTYVSGQVVSALMLETQLPSNPGDSGGPVINDQGQLVGVNAAGAMGDAGVNLCIDVQEVRAFLDKARTLLPGCFTDSPPKRAEPHSSGTPGRLDDRPLPTPVDKPSRFSWQNILIAAGVAAGLGFYLRAQLADLLRRIKEATRT